MVKIVILGGGFGGIRAALDLDRKLSAREVSITVVDRNNYHLFLPALYEVASAYGIGADPYQLKLRRAISISYADIFEHTKVNFVQGEVVAVDWSKKEIVTNGEHAIAFDHLILGLGAETDTFGVAGVAEYAFKFKTIDEAIFLNQRILGLYRKAAQGRHSLPIKFVIAGAGFNGIELAAELACCIKNLKNACKLHENCTFIAIIEAGPQILPAITPDEREKIERRLMRLGIKILTNTLVKEVGPNFVVVQGEQGEQKLETDIMIWTAGVRAVSLLKKIEGLPLDHRGKIIVNEFLQIEGVAGGWALGDNVTFTDKIKRREIPGLAYVAIAQGKIVAENIKRQVRNPTAALKLHNPFYGVWVAPVGGKFAVAHLREGLTIFGLLGWMIRLLIDLRYFASILPWSKAWKLFEKETLLFAKND